MVDKPVAGLPSEGTTSKEQPQQNVNRKIGIFDL